MSDTVEIPIPEFAADGALAKKPKRHAKVAVAQVKTTSRAPSAPEELSLNSALAEIESARVTKRTPHKPVDKAKRQPPKYVRKRP